MSFEISSEWWNSFGRTALKPKRLKTTITGVLPGSLIRKRIGSSCGSQKARARNQSGIRAVPIKPPRLNYGDTIGIIAPASAPPDPKAIDRSIEAVARLGFKPKLAANVRKRWGFLA